MKRLNAVHSSICSVPASVLLGYFGWPSVTVLQDGSLAAVASGFRAAHVCACGKTVLFTSHDEGNSWNLGEIINDSMADDRDAGVLSLQDGRLLISWFSSDVRVYYPESMGSETVPVLEALNDHDLSHYIGSFLRYRNTDGHWTKPEQVLVSAPHGPIQLANGDLFYLGTIFGRQKADGSIFYKMHDNRRGLAALRSTDGGKNWKTLGVIPNAAEAHYCEPHALELKDGSILGMIRICYPFGIARTISHDGGLTWSKPIWIVGGAPPHLMRHSSGVIICSYGWRNAGYGQRVMFSMDEGKTWDTDWIIRDDAPDPDLGYPCTVELKDGSLFTVYYQHEPGNRNASLLASRWTLPEL